MPRTLVVAAAQLGPISRGEPRSSAVGRMCRMMRQAAAEGAGLVVFPELALTTFFPRWFMQDQSFILKIPDYQFFSSLVLRHLQCRKKWLLFGV